MKQPIVQRIAALKPRNLFAIAARKRHGGRHADNGRAANSERRDLLQRLREAGL